MSQPPEQESNATPPARHNRTSKWLVRAFLGLVVIVIGLELSLRLILGLGNPVLYQHDPACGYLPVPNQNVTRFWKYHNQISAFGMRSAAVTQAKPAGTYRVLFIGDSVTYGTTHVDQSQIFTSLLQHDLPGVVHEPVEVLNASTGAWAVDNELGYLRSRGTFDADAVVFVLNTGDLVQPFNPGTLTSEAGYPDHKPALAMEELWVRYVGPRFFRTGMAADAGSTAEKEPDVDHVTPGILQSLSQAQRIATDAGAQFGIVYSPVVGADWKNPAYGRGLEMLRQWAQEHQVTLIDMTAAYSTRPESEVYQDGVHLRPLGNQIVAQTLTEHWPWPPRK